MKPAARRKGMRISAALVAASLTACGYSMHAFNADEQYGPTAPWAEDVVIHTSQHVVLGFSGDNDFVDEAHRKLLATCRDGHLFNIQTRFTTELSFLNHENHLTLWAVCQRQPPPAPPPPPVPAAPPESAVPAAEPAPSPSPKTKAKPHHHHNKRHRH